MEKRNCLVTGATGVVGAGLVGELTRRGHSVKVLARGKVKPNSFPGAVEIVPGDLADAAAIEKATANADWVFHLAAKLHINNPGADLKKEYEATNVEGTHRLLAAARRNRVEKFIFFSTINVHGASAAGEVFDESSAVNPQGFYAESKAAAEQLILNENFGIVLRLSAVYGSRMKGNYVRLLSALRRGRFFFVGDGSNRRTLVHQTDVALAAILAAEKAAGGAVYNLTDGKIHTLREIVTAMSAALGKKTPRLRLPLAPLRLGIGAAEDLGRIINLKTPVNRALLEKFLEDVAASGDKIQRELGFQPQFDLARGWQETVEKGGR
jgi:UDP-glucose 4-epimerase